MWNRFKKYWFDSRFLVSNFEQREAMQAWFKTPYGVRLYEAEQAFHNDNLEALFGFHLAQLSVLEGGLDNTKSTINHRFSISPDAESQVGLCSECENLPLASDCIDVSILHHVLENSQDPHQLLREAARITVPHGYLVIYCFNPFSLQGLRKEIARWLLGSRHHTYHNISSSRIVDWLKLLDFNVMNVACLDYDLPSQNISFLQRTQRLARALSSYQLPGNAVNVILARKEVSLGTPLRNGWEALKPSLGFPVAKPSRFVHNHHSVKRKDS